MSQIPPPPPVPPYSAFSTAPKSPWHQLEDWKKGLIIAGIAAFGISVAVFAGPAMKPDPCKQAYELEHKYDGWTGNRVLAKQAEDIDEILTLKEACAKEQEKEFIRRFGE